MRDQTERIPKFDTLFVVADQFPASCPIMTIGAHNIMLHL